MEPFSRTLLEPVASVRYIRVPTSSGRRIYIKRYPCFTVSLFLQASTRRIMPASGHLVAQITPAKRTGTGGFIAAPLLHVHRIQRASNFRPSLLNFFHTEFRFASEMLVPSISDRSLRPVHSAYLSSPSPRKINSSDRRDYDSISSTEHWRTSNFRPQFPSSGSADERGLYPIWKPKHVPGTCYVLPFLFFPPSLSSVLREFKRAKTRLRFVDNYQLRPDTCVTRDTVTDNDPL